MDGKKLLKLRIKYGITQKKAAAVLGYSYNYIRRVENFEKKLKPYEADILTEYFEELKNAQ